MGDLNADVLKLARNICAGRCGLRRAEEAIRSLEEKYGDWDMPVELPDGKNMSDEQYLKTLANTINSGVFSKEALLKMASLSEKVNESNKSTDKTKLAIGGIIIAAIVIGIIVIVSVGGRK